MNFLPKELEDIIMDYKEQFEMVGKRELILKFIIDSVEYEVKFIIKYGWGDGDEDEDESLTLDEWNFKDKNDFTNLQMKNLLKLNMVELDFYIMLSKKLKDMYKVDKEYMRVGFRCSGFCWTKTNTFVILNER